MRNGVVVGTVLVVLGTLVAADGATILCRKKSGAILARDGACKKKEVALDLSALGIAAASHGHTGADIADDAIGANHIADYQKTIGFPAQALNYDVGTAAIDEAAAGLRWNATFSGGAFLSLPRPSDYAGGDVELAIYFYPESNTAGAVEFFIRPRSYVPGDLFNDVIDVSSAPVTVGTSTEVKKQTFTIVASKVEKEFWVVTMQRGGSGETYPDSVIVMGIALTYTASR